MLLRADAARGGSIRTDVGGYAIAAAVGFGAVWVADAQDDGLVRRV